jgi:hypothetical protein
MSDNKWRFDPYKDYTSEEEYDKRDNFQKFKPKKKKKSFNDEYTKKSKKKGV